MNSIAPIWDGNETWLVFGGLGLLAAFPLAFAIIIPAVYFPILIMLLALVFRGVAFEFRFKRPALRRFWDRAFCRGSAVATFAQGVVLGSFHPGLQGRGPHLRRHLVRLGDAVRAAHRRRADVRLCAARRRLADPEDRRRVATLGAALRHASASSACWSPSSRSASGRRSRMPTSRSAGSPGRISPFSRRCRSSPR